MPYPAYASTEKAHHVLALRLGYEYVGDRLVGTVRLLARTRQPWDGTTLPLPPMADRFVSLTHLLQPAQSCSFSFRVAPTAQGLFTVNAVGWGGHYESHKIIFLGQYKPFDDDELPYSENASPAQPSVREMNCTFWGNGVLELVDGLKSSHDRLRIAHLFSETCPAAVFAGVRIPLTHAAPGCVSLTLHDFTLDADPAAGAESFAGQSVFSLG